MSDVLSIIDDERPANRSTKLSLGDLGEKLAVDHLIRKGFDIVVTNFKAPVGRNSKGVSVTGEIDIIAIDGDTLCFVEVKTRTSEDFAPAITAVDLRKQRQITRTSKVYRRLFNLESAKVRFDVITVVSPNNEKPAITLTKSLWTEGSFSKRRWHEPF
ncbi:MAG TPA: YraN family protein [Pyrinomonadaceae bacterium]|nr:YraN family protein [Pyrinomonadaceae bacterium]